MDSYDKLPEKRIHSNGPISDKFIELGITSFREACLFVHHMPYGYNSDKDKPFNLFLEGIGSCTSKHGVIATLAEELGIPLYKNIGVYKFTEAISQGTAQILAKYNLPYIPMVHCFLVFEIFRFDLTEGNKNGKETSIEEFIQTNHVIPFITRKDEYLLFRKIVRTKVLPSLEMQGAEMQTILKAREEVINLLHEKVD